MVWLLFESSIASAEVWVKETGKPCSSKHQDHKNMRTTDQLVESPAGNTMPTYVFWDKQNKIVFKYKPCCLLAPCSWTTFLVKLSTTRQDGARSTVCRDSYIVSGKLWMLQQQQLQSQEQEAGGRHVTCTCHHHAPAPLPTHSHTHMHCVDPTSPWGRIYSDKSLLSGFQVLLVHKIGHLYHLSGNSRPSGQQLKPFNAEPFSLRRGGFSPSSILASHCKCLSQLQQGTTDACPQPPQSYKGQVRLNDPHTSLVTSAFVCSTCVCGYSHLRDNRCRIRLLHQTDYLAQLD